MSYTRGVPKDIWNLIGNSLDVRSLLALRATNKHMNAQVIAMQSRWYRAHQWFLIRNSKSSKVKDAIRVHARTFTRNCLIRKEQDYNLEFPGRPADLTGEWTRTTDNYYRLLGTMQNAIDDGHFVAEKDCKFPNHFVNKVPKTELDIPLDKHFKPKKNNYIYHYLIECYRQFAPRHASLIQSLHSHYVQQKQQVENCENYVRHYKPQLPVLLAEYEQKKQKFQNNNIFVGYAINGYKTPTQLKTGKAPTKRKAPTKKKKQ